MRIIIALLLSAVFATTYITYERPLIDGEYPDPISPYIEQTSYKNPSNNAELVAVINDDSKLTSLVIDFADFNIIVIPKETYDLWKADYDAKELQMLRDMGLI